MKKTNYFTREIMDLEWDESIFNEPLISIYTPTYNRNKLLRERALTSVLNQTYTNWEYIIVHDGLNADFLQIINSYDDSRIKPYCIERQTPEHNFDTELQWLIGGTYPANYALDKVKGEWIARLDDDDFWSKNHLEKSLKFALEGNYDFITSQFVILKGNRGIYVDCSKHRIVEKDIKIGCHSSWFYNSKIKLRYDPECYKKEWNRVNDADFLERLFKTDIKYGFKSDATVYLKVREGDINIGMQAVKDKIQAVRDKIEG